jgi:hypothetical protein
MCTAQVRHPCPAGGQGIKLLAHNAACSGLPGRMPLSLLLLGVHDGITINCGDEVIPLSPTLLVCYVLLICCVHYVLAKSKE